MSAFGFWKAELEPRDESDQLGRPGVENLKGLDERKCLDQDDGDDHEDKGEDDADEADNISSDDEDESMCLRDSDSELILRPEKTVRRQPKAAGTEKDTSHECSLGVEKDVAIREGKEGEEARKAKGF